MNDNDKSSKSGKWVFRPWITINGKRVYPKPPNRVFRWWEEEASDDKR